MQGENFDVALMVQALLSLDSDSDPEVVQEPQQQGHAGAMASLSSDTDTERAGARHGRRGWNLSNQPQEPL